MKKTTRIRSLSLVLAIVLALGMILPASAASGDYNFHSSGGGTLYVITREGAPLREADHDEGKILTRLSKNQVFTVTESHRNWKGSLWLTVQSNYNGKQIKAYMYSGNAVKLYYDRYTGSSGSIVTVCKKLGIDSSFGARAKLALANGIVSSTAAYKGSAEQNTALVKLAKTGKLIRSGLNPVFDKAPAANTVSTATYFPKYSGKSGSLVDALRAVGAQSNFAYRTEVAKANGMHSYSGQASENISLLNLLRQGLLKMPGGADSSSNTSSGGSTNTSSGSTSAVLVNANANLSVSNRARLNGVKYTSYEGQRSAAALNTVIDQYYVSSNARYQRCADGRTWCNVYATDVTNALNAIIPHWVKNGAPAEVAASGAWEMNANATCNWLRDYGAKYGWTKVSSAQEAQNRANAGYPTVAVWKNPSGGSGHIAIIRPEGSGYYYSASKGPVIAQAGWNCYNRANLIDGFGSSKMSSVVYYTHN